MVTMKSDREKEKTRKKSLVLKINWCVIKVNLKVISYNVIIICYVLYYKYEREKWDIQEN